MHLFEKIYKMFKFFIEPCKNKQKPHPMGAVFGFILPAIMMFSTRIMQECTRAAIKLEFSGERISELILAGAVNAVILPVMIIIFDLIANKLEINTFSGWILRQKNEDAE